MSSNTPIIASAAAGDRPKVLTLGQIGHADPNYLKEFESRFELHTIQPSDRAGIVRLVADTAKAHGPFAAVVLLRDNGAYGRFDKELFAPLVPDLKIVACVNARYSELDLEWFSRNKVYVTSTVDAFTRPTADITMFLILAVLRDTSNFERNVRLGGWRNVTSPPRDPYGLKLGIIGMGKVGKHVARKAKVFGMTIQYHNRFRIPTDEEQNLDVAYCAELKDLIATSDVISINAPLTDTTRGLIGEAEVAAMKDGVFLVNTGGGPIVDEKALIKAIWSGKIARVGLDVFADEPRINPFFRGSDKCVVQPHMGSWTDLAWKNAYHEALENVTALFREGRPISPVNSVE